MTAPRVLPCPQQKITEQQFTDQVLDAAKIFHWRRVHFRPALTTKGWRTPLQGDGAGFPDLILLRNSRGIAAELKRPKTKTLRLAWGKRHPGFWRARVEIWERLDVERDLFQPGQIDWLDAFEQAGVETYLWIPDDLDEITKILR